ncbi:MAG: serine acetyltransferase [Microbacterium sp.]|nr:serine acetyltransferase [Microbacterium sp.]
MSAWSRLREDLAAARLRDPAARSSIEIALLYPGLHALWAHRLWHRLWLRRFRFLARAGSQITRWLTGIEIHPGATIGAQLFIDHGTGIVIGETCVIGDRVRLYQGVTLGGEPLPAGAAHSNADPRARRHPFIADDVVIFAGAVLLGPITIGARSRIGGNLWLRTDVPPDSIVELETPRIRPAGTSASREEF